MKSDNLGDRMKNYERRSQSLLPRRTHTMIRLDGKAFHTYTKHCKRPYDLGLMRDMDNTAKYLCENIQGCKLAYVQSDEITLALTDFTKITTDAWFDGNVQKITSISAALATAKFNDLRLERWKKTITGLETAVSLIYQLGEFIENRSLALFDSRCWVIPDIVEVHNCFVWRQQDAVRNSIQMLGQYHFSHKQLHKKSCNDIQDMLMIEKKVNWNDCPAGFKRGRCVVREESGWKIIDAPQFTQKTNIDFISKNLIKIETESGEANFHNSEE
jgi:tRNA(His) guanylyltransferase